MIFGFGLKGGNMIELFEKDIRRFDSHSSKGNQWKWTDGLYWYKADYTGYEGLSEYVVSKLLSCSDLRSEEYVQYETEKIQYEKQCYQGCRSRDFLKRGWQLITLERLFQAEWGESLYKRIYQIPDYEKRLLFLVEEAEQITGLAHFGRYMCKLLTIDALFLNEDRHTHNIAVLWDGGHRFEYCPIFDQGAALLSDTAVDYPMGVDVLEFMQKVKSKTFCSSFEEQLDIAEKIYGEQMHFFFGEKEIQEVLEADIIYSEEVKERVRTILLQQRRKYHYMFI